MIYGGPAYFRGEKITWIDEFPDGKGELDGKGLFCKAPFPEMGKDEWLLYDMVFYNGHVLTIGLAYSKTKIIERIVRGAYTTDPGYVRWGKKVKMVLNRATLDLSDNLDTKYTCKLETPEEKRVRYQDEFNSLKAEMKKNKL